MRSALHCGAARKHLAACTPDVICIDVGLPDQSGYELCEYIRGPLDLRDVPILMTSECGTAPEMAYAEDAGGTAFLCKPFAKRELGRRVLGFFEAA